MEVIEAVAVIILIIAIVVLIYYYLLNTPKTMNKLKAYIPTSADAHMNEVLNKNTEYKDSESVTKRIKVKLSDIDKASINTDAFSKKLDSFLDEKSDELIKDWSLATKNDLGDLEAKFAETTKSVDALDKDYQEFKKSSKEFQEAAEEVCEHYFKGLYDIVVGESEHCRRKPSPDGINMICEKFDVPHEDVLFFGDSEVDIKTADNAGAYCVSVLWGYRDREFLAENGAKVFVSNPLDIADIID